MISIPYKLFEQAKKDYYHNPKRTAYTRFGQLLCNRFLHETASWPELFYETDDAKAEKLFFSIYTLKV